MKKTELVLTNSKYFSKQISFGGERVLEIICTQFNDGEIDIKIPPEFQDQKSCQLLFSLTPHINEKLIELLLCLGTLEEMETEVDLIIPYLPYARKDQVDSNHESLAIKTIGKLLANSKVIKNIQTLDIHNPNSLVFFGEKISHHNANQLFTDWVNKNIGAQENLLCVAPDQGSYQSNQALAKALHVPTIKCIKKRSANDLSVKLDDSKIKIQNKICLVRDDMIDSGKTMVVVVNRLLELGAQQVYLLATHGVFSHPSQEFRYLLEKPEIKCVVADTVEQPSKHELPLITISVAELLLMK